MNTMKAAVVPALGAPLEIRDLAVPDPGPGQVLVRMEASGICHTDIHAAHGDWPVTPTPPFVPGHEGIGIIEKVGAGVRRPASRRPGGHRLARVGLRPLPLLRLRLRDAVRDPAEQRLLGRRRVRRVRRRRRALRRARPRRASPPATPRR